MSAAAPALAAPVDRRPIPAATFEILAYFIILVAATLAFLLGWLTIPAAIVLTVAILVSLVVLSWVHLGQGRHPVFLFLCTLLFFQGGRLVAFCLGGIPYPLRVQLMQDSYFGIGRTNEGIVLLCLTVSAVCVYLPSRWRYKPSALPDLQPVQRFLPYLWLLFVAAIPVQFFKNVRYLQWAQQHGGYSSIYMSHASLAASVPFLVRIIPLISFPVFVAIFVFEERRGRAYAAAFFYFAAAAVILLLGARGGVFALLLSLWYVARVKAKRKTRIVAFVVLGLALFLLADLVRQNREDSSAAEYHFDPVEFLNLQGASIDVLSAVVTYRDYFAPHAWKYPIYELQDAFVAIDTEHYERGKLLPYDVPVLLNRNAYLWGAGTGGSYIAEAYAIAGFAGVVLISLAVGFGLGILHRIGQSAIGLFFVVLTLPDVLLMPRGELLDWLSVLFKNGLSVVILAAGWFLYSLLASVRAQRQPASAPLAGAS